MTREGKIMQLAKGMRGRVKHCYKLVLSSNAKRARAHEFYDKLGFRRHGISFWIDLPPDGTSGEEAR